MKPCNSLGSDNNYGVTYARGGLWVGLEKSKQNKHRHKEPITIIQDVNQHIIVVRARIEDARTDHMIIKSPEGRGGSVREGSLIIESYFSPRYRPEAEFDASCYMEASHRYRFDATGTESSMWDETHRPDTAATLGDTPAYLPLPFAGFECARYSSTRACVSKLSQSIGLIAS